MTKAEMLADLKSHGIEKQSMAKAIRAKCMDCSCYQVNEISGCIIKDCPLYPFRMGKNPWGTRKGNPNALANARSARLALSVASEN